MGEISKGGVLVGEISKRGPLLPNRNSQRDLFVCDIFDAVPKGDMASMEHPVFSLATKKDNKPRRYETGDKKKWLVVKPGPDGLATVHDRDVLIYCISQVIAAINQGRDVSRRLSVNAYELLKSTNRMTCGQGYSGLKAALERLKGTVIETNICTGDIEQIDAFNLLDRYRIVRETREGRMLDLEIELSDWVYNAIQAKQVLTLHPNYFRLRKPLERRLYELARKRCGRQDSWSVSLLDLKDKCGSMSTPKEFRRLIEIIIIDNAKHQHFPDYNISMIVNGSLAHTMIKFINRGTIPDKKEAKGDPQLDQDTHHRAYNTAFHQTGVRVDTNVMYEEWVKMWRESGSPPIKNYAAAFIGFTVSRAKLMQ